MRVLGVDPGSRRVGLSLSDEEGVVAMPLCTVQRRGAENTVREIADLAAERGVERVVVGLPLRLDGTEGPEARRARAFGASIFAQTQLPVVYWDERLTTAAAQRSLREANVRREKRRQVVDQVAATLLLQSYLDAKAGPAWDRDDDHGDPG